MKRFFAILLVTLYVTLTSGVAVNVHYCMGKLAGVDLHDSPADVCNKCKKPAKGMDCCKDEVKFCKLTESHQGAKVAQQNDIAAIDLRLPVIVLSAPALTSLATLNSTPHDPPDASSTPLFLRNRIFRI